MNDKFVQAVMAEAEEWDIDDSYNNDHADDDADTKEKDAEEGAKSEVQTSWTPPRVALGGQKSKL
jgi:hypothetical protein